MSLGNGEGGGKLIEGRILATIERHRERSEAIFKTKPGGGLHADHEDLGVSAQLKIWRQLTTV